MNILVRLTVFEIWEQRFCTIHFQCGKNGHWKGILKQQWEYHQRKQGALVIDAPSWIKVVSYVGLQYESHWLVNEQLFVWLNLWIWSNPSQDELDKLVSVCAELSLKRFFLPYWRFPPGLGKPSCCTRCSYGAHWRCELVSPRLLLLLFIAVLLLLLLNLGAKPSKL